MKLFIILIILKLFIIHTKALSENLEPVHKSFILCTLKIIQNYFGYTETIAVVVPPRERNNNVFITKFNEEILDILHKLANWTIFMKKSAEIYRYVAVNRKKTNNYILEVMNQEDINNTLYYLKQNQWNPQARFIIILIQPYKDAQSLILDIANILWKYHVVNGIILTSRYSDSNILDIYTWKPYNMGKCGRNITETYLINTCIDGEYRNKNINLYSNKIPLDMNGCPIYVRTVLWPPFIIPPPNLNRTKIGINFTEGIEIQMMNTIAKAANFNVVYTISVTKQDWGLLFNNGSATGGLFKHLIEEKSDIGMSALAATVNRYNYLDSINSYSTESVTWCVPSAEEEAKWISLIKILKFYTWISTIGSLLVIGFIIWRISLISAKESPIFKNLFNCYLYSFSTTLCLTIKTQPKTIYVRIVFIMWVIYSYTLCSAYQTSLITTLTQPEYEEEISSVETIFNSKLQFGYLNGLQIYFDDESNVAEKMRTEGLICSDAEICINRIANDRDFALIVPRTYLKYVSTGYYGKNGRLKINWFKSDTVSYPIQMYSYKGFPLIGRINDLTLRIKSGGLIKKWMSNTILSYIKNRKDAGNFEVEEKNHVLKFVHMQGPFLLLLIGLSLSTIIFLMEIAHFKIRQMINSYRTRQIYNNNLYLE